MEFENLFSQNLHLEDQDNAISPQAFKIITMLYHFKLLK
jgi:hypothetical protein